MDYELWERLNIEIIKEGTFVTIKHDDNQKLTKEEGNLINDQKHGYWMGYYPNGNINYKGFYEKGIKTSCWTTFEEDGCVYEKGTFLNNLRHGEWIQFMSTDQVWFRTNYKEGLEHGQSIVYHPNGLVKLFEIYDSGKKNGIYLEFFENGQIAWRGEYTGNFTHFYLVD